MAVTTTYSLDFVNVTGIAYPTEWSEADTAGGLSNGGFVMTTKIDSDNQTFIHIYNADSGLFAFTLVGEPGTNAAVAQLLDGNLALVTQDADSILLGNYESGACVQKTNPSKHAVIQRKQNIDSSQGLSF